MVSAAGESRRGFCYAAWRNVSGDILLERQGCWVHDCRGRSKCVESSSNPFVYFCCCDRDLCNIDFALRPRAHEGTQQPTPVARPVPTPVALLAVTTLLLLLLLLLLSVWMYRRCRKLTHATTPPQEAVSLTALLLLRPVRLLEFRGGGRFGCVWRAQLLSEIVAVKIVQPVVRPHTHTHRPYTTHFCASGRDLGLGNFTRLLPPPLLPAVVIGIVFVRDAQQNQRLWQNEVDIFGTPGLSHRNLLEFIGAERREGNAEAELWIITAFHERGSLSDHLKCSMLSWAELCHIGETLACGLAHLHHHVHGGKPAIAHRDLKSNNVLLRSDLSAVIADFGLALKLQPGRPLGDIPRVGTLCYMAPELLEGAVCLRRDAFLRIDVYALGLVLWEIATRCTAGGGVLGEHRAPFEDEVGECPTLDELQHIVVHGNGRPAIQEPWLKHPGLSQLCVTMEECWDKDAEARLSAHCVEERLAQLRTDPGLPGGSGGTTAAAPPTTTTTIITAPPPTTTTTIVTAPPPTTTTTTVTAPPPTTTIVTAPPPTATVTTVTAPPPTATTTTIVTAPPPTTTTTAPPPTTATVTAPPPTATTTTIVTTPPPTTTATVTAPPPTTTTATVTAPPPTTGTARPFCSDPGVVVRLSTPTPPSLLLLVAPIEESSL
ncbi:activin receptor type-2B-like [Petromyzon marinus]|uniref:activin receptor type-2B-like n=1 Tax=Petromyzon marinus TaxID=7757 RepID=UPI003F709A5B